jgi:hypothetical protein
VEVQSNVDLSKCHLEAKLLYDFDREEDQRIEVAFVKSEPLEYKVTLLDGGTKASVELRIKVLTSQHEDMLFRVRLTGIDPLTGISFETYTQPIKVISKLTQLKKPTGVSPGLGQKRKSVTAAAVPSMSPVVSGVGVMQPPSLPDNSIASTLARLEASQQEHKHLLNLIISKLFDPSQTLRDAVAQQQQILQQQMLQQQQQDQGLATMANLVVQQSLGEEGYATSVSTPPTDLHSSQNQPSVDDEFKQKEAEAALWKFASVFDDIPPEERKKKIQSMLENSSSIVADRLSDIVEAFDSAQLKKKIKASSSAPTTSSHTILVASNDADADSAIHNNNGVELQQMQQ